MNTAFPGGSDVADPMPPPSANLETAWAFLERHFDDIMKNPTDVTGFQKHVSLYTAVFNYYTYEEIPRIDPVSSRAADARIEQRISSLYDKVVEYFATHARTVAKGSDSLQDEELVRYYAVEWTRYTKAADSIHRLLNYLNRHWVRYHRSRGRKDVYPVFALALIQWESNILLHVQGNHSNLSNLIVKMIEHRRNGGVIDEGLVKTIVASFVSLGLDEDDINKRSLAVYKQHLEPFLLEASQQHYQRRYESYLAECIIPDYLKKVEEFITEEERVVSFFDMGTQQRLISECEELFIRRRSDLIWDSFKNIHFDAVEDLPIMLAALSRVPEVLEPVQKKFQEHVKTAGLSAISVLVGEGLEGADGFNPKTYVDVLVELHRKFSAMVMYNLRAKGGFGANLDNAFKELVNRNAATGTSTTKSSELLARHADMLLTKNNRTASEEDLEGGLNRIMVLFKYVEDKDIFQKFYISKLSKRLIQGMSISPEVETSMISKLGEVCGFEYTEKMRCVLTDVGLSKDLSDQFNGWIQRNNDDGTNVNFNIVVLRTNAWPLNTPTNDFIIPPEILSVHNRFSEYYQTRHSGRKLTWLWNYSKNELRTSYLDQKYTLMMSSYQMAVLLRYNEHDTLSLEDLVVATAISKGILVQVLSHLVKAGILLNKSDRYDLNPNFKSTKIRVSLNRPVKEETNAESSDFLKTVDEHRKYTIQAAIVRIMKVHKTMAIQPLIQEVISLVLPRFAPKVSDIKKAIEKLVEEEYIERAEGAMDTSAYIA